MKRERNLILIAALAAIFLVATACSSSSSSSSSAAGTSTSASSSGEAPANVQGMSTFAVDANNFFFSPSALEGTAGQQLTLTMSNKGTTTHTFTIDSENIDVTLAPGQSQPVDVTFPQTGSVEFYCKFHVASGMKGTLQVM